MKIKGKNIAKGVGIAGAIAAAVIYFFTREKDKEGDRKCVNFDLYEYRNGQWSLVEANSTVCGWQPGEAEFQLSDLIIEPTIVNIGELVNISVIVTNTGENRGTKVVTLEVTQVYTKSVTLDPGESKQISFQVIPTETKIYTVLVNGLTGSFEVLPAPIEMGIIQGYVIDGNTGDHIPNAAIYLDGNFVLYSWTSDVGGYRIADIPYGPHIITVEANNYETTDFEIMVNQSIQSNNLEMLPLLPGPPGDWSDGVEVQNVFVEPIAYLGKTVNIDVYIQYGIHNPDTYPTPATIFGTAKVDGQELHEEFNIDYRNPILRFQYKATQIGEFMAVAQGKSAKFTVANNPQAKYYPPHGGSRFPVCTVLRVEDTKLTSEEKEPGGNVFKTLNAEIANLLPEAYPSAWIPYEAVVRQSEMFIPPPPDLAPWGYPVGKFAFIMPTDYDCPQYWASKEELAEVIAGTWRLGIGTWPYHYFPLEEWLSKFGSKIALFVGYRDWERNIGWGSNSTDGSYVITLRCPYCSTVLQGPRTVKQSLDVLPLARALIEHIENDHPAHPLTEPAWF